MSTERNAFGEAFDKPLTDDFEHDADQRERRSREYRQAQQQTAVFNAVIDQIFNPKPPTAQL